MAGRGGSPRRAPAAPAVKRREPSRLRVLALLGIALVLSGTVWARLAYWQVLRHDELSALADAQHVANVTLPATRGLITDVNGRPLALNTTVYDVSLSPPSVQPSQRAMVANGLAAVLGVSADDIGGVLASRQKFAYVQHRVAKDKADQLSRMNLPGVLLTGIPERTYLDGGNPSTTLASGLLGFVDYTGQGQRGIEQFYQKELGGTNGQTAVDLDSSGQPILSTTHNRRDPVNGQNLKLTIDSDAQYIAEQAIAQGVARNKGIRGSVIIMDTRTGGIAAWASSPGYDANNFAATDPAKTQDPIASQLYEPGSVMKVVTLSGAIDAGAIRPDTVIDDPGYVNVQGWPIRDDELVNQGQVTMTKVLDDSLNVGAVKAQQMEGRDNYLQYLHAFGFGQPTGAGVAAEAAQPLAPNDRWNDAGLATASFGQGIAVNMIQMVAAINTIANGGVYVQPHVVDSVGGQAVQPQTHRAVSAQTADQMNMMMRSVVQHGSGWMARMPGFELDQTGKTGTAQKPENGAYGQHVWASYVGSLPAQNPRFTMLVMVDQPDNGSAMANEGFYVSGPIWKQIAQQLVLHWQIAPEQLAPVGQ